MMLPTECIQHILTFIPVRRHLFTLHSLLLLNTDFAHAVLPILYADPSKALEQYNATVQARSPWRRARLLETLVACIDTSSTLKGLTQEPPTVITPALMLVLRRLLMRISNTPRSSMKYLEHMSVHALTTETLWLNDCLVLQPWIKSEVLSDSLQCDLEAARPTISRWITFGIVSTCHRSIHVMRPHKWHWPSTAFWKEPSPSSSHSLHHQVMFPHLQHIDIRSIEPASQPHLIEFVQQHHAAFPGVLSKLAIAVYNVDHGFSIALLKSFGDSLRDLEIYNWPWQIDFLSDGGQIAVPERLERLILPINMHPLWDFDKYLDRLERLETLGVSVERDFIFKDAQNRKLTKQELPLRRLRHLRLRSYTSRTNLMTALENAIFAYKDQLESLVVDPLFLPLNRDEMVSWAEPEAFSLAFDGPVPAGLPISNITTVPNPNQGILLNTGNNQEAPIDITVPNLLNPRLTHVFVKTYMPALRVLHLNDMIAMHFSMWSLAACPALESLTLDISNSIRTLYSHENEALLGRTGNWSMCCVPNLRELHLRGPWRIPYRTLNAMVTQQQVDVILSDPVVAAGDTAMPVSSRNRARPDRKHYARRHPLRKLEVLDASGAQALTAMEIGRLVGKLPSLREIIVAVEADEKDNLSLWTKEHGGLVDVRSFIRTFESEYDTPM